MREREGCEDRKDPKEGTSLRGDENTLSPIRSSCPRFVYPQLKFEVGRRLRVP